MTDFLNISKSLTGRHWVGPSIEQDRRAQALHQQTTLPLPLCNILARRNIDTDQADSFLNPTLKDLLPDPLTLKDMHPAAARFVKALQGREKIAVFADYDVDGGTSAALLLDWLRQMGHDATLYVPDRIKEGYGPNSPAMKMLARDHDLIVCVDCGTLSHGPIAAAKGADVVVLDHHLGGETLPDAFQRITLAELGVRLNIVRARLLGAWTHLYPQEAFRGLPVTDIHYVTLGYHLEHDLNAGALPAEQHGAFRWFPIAEAQQHPEVHRYTQWYLEALTQAP